MALPGVENLLQRRQGAPAGRQGGGIPTAGTHGLPPGRRGRPFSGDRRGGREELSREARRRHEAQKADALRQADGPPAVQGGPRGGRSFEEGDPGGRTREDLKERTRAAGPRLRGVLVFERSRRRPEGKGTDNQVARVEGRPARSAQGVQTHQARILPAADAAVGRTRGEAQVAGVDRADQDRSDLVPARPPLRGRHRRVFVVEDLPVASRIQEARVGPSRGPVGGAGPADHP
mmetsp:Transcript_1682/g.5735  ORF Transcript_1682/g.5735 Transcript_1682/m.5735 type:complete len:233 (-) Transcript_1682:1192-1890(-)